MCERDNFWEAWTKEGRERLVVLGNRKSVRNPRLGSVALSGSSKDKVAGKHWSGVSILLPAPTSYTQLWCHLEIVCRIKCHSVEATVIENRPSWMSRLASHTASQPHERK